MIELSSRPSLPGTMRVKTILVLVELDNGHVHQVLASAEQKEICLALMRTENGVLLLSERVAPVVLAAYPGDGDPAHLKSAPGEAQLREAGLQLPGQKIHG